MTDLFTVLLDKGTKVEDFIIDYFEECLGWFFLAGTKNGKILNHKFIENEFGCKFIPPNSIPFRKHGALLDFEDGEESSIMPDILFKSSNNVIFWSESKSSFNDDFSSFDLEVKKFESYKKIQKASRKTVYIVFTIVSNNFCRVYSTTINRINKMIDSGRIIMFKNNNWAGKSCYRLNIDLPNLFEELTDEPIQFC